MDKPIQSRPITKTRILKVEIELNEDLEDPGTDDETLLIHISKITVDGKEVERLNDDLQLDARRWELFSTLDNEKAKPRALPIIIALTEEINF